jgi:hypothetical protein
LAIQASGPHVENVGFYHIAGTCCIIRRGAGNLNGAIMPFDREFATLSNVSAYRAYRGIEIETIDTELGVGAIEAQYLRDYGVKVTGGAVKFGGVVHVSGVHSGVAPADYGTAVWFDSNAGGCWGGTWYCETADVGMRIDSSGNKLTNFYSKNCTYRNLWITGQRNSLVNFEIDVKEDVTEVHGGEGVLIANQSNMLSNGTFGAVDPVPAGEIAIRIKNGTRQTIRDVDFVGTSGSSAPLISVEHQLNESVIAAKCFTAGTFLDLHPVYTTGKARAGTNTSIQLAAATGLVDDELNGMTVFITAGTGSVQARTITDYDAGSATATVSSAWTMPNPTNGSTYEVRANRLGTRNEIQLSTSPKTVTKVVNLPPTWDESNKISVDGLRVRGSITDVSAASSAVITSPGHGLSNNDKISIVAVEGETAVNSASGQVHVVTYLTDDTFSIPVNTTGGSSYVPGTGYWGNWEAK